MCGNFYHDEKGNHVNNAGELLPEGTTEEEAKNFDVTEEFAKVEKEAEVEVEPA